MLVLWSLHFILPTALKPSLLPEMEKGKGENSSEAATLKINTEITF